MLISTLRNSSREKFLNKLRETPVTESFLILEWSQSCNSIVKNSFAVVYMVALGNLSEYLSCGRPVNNSVSFNTARLVADGVTIEA